MRSGAISTGCRFVYLFLLISFFLFLFFFFLSFLGKKDTYCNIFHEDKIPLIPVHTVLKFFCSSTGMHGT